MSGSPRTESGKRLLGHLRGVHEAGYIGGTTMGRIEVGIPAIEAEAAVPAGEKRKYNERWGLEPDACNCHHGSARYCSHHTQADFDAAPEAAERPPAIDAGTALLRTVGNLPSIRSRGIGGGYDVDLHEVEEAIMSRHPSRPMTRGSYLQLVDFERVEEWCRSVRLLFDGAVPYMVGSVNRHPDFRDIDIRLLLEDKEFARQFADPVKHRLMNRAISTWGQRETGLPIDFQVQQQSAANDQFEGEFRNPMGLRDWTTSTPDGRPKQERAAARATSPQKPTEQIGGANGG